MGVSVTVCIANQDIRAPAIAVSASRAIKVTASKAQIPVPFLKNPALDEREVRVSIPGPGLFSIATVLTRCPF